MLHKKESKGFTLIELLVVIAIIAILSSVVIWSVQDAHVKANDKRRLRDFHEIRSALALYLTENGDYPNCSQHYVVGDNGCLGQALVGGGHMPVMPTDPQSSGSGQVGVDYEYAYQDGAYYLRTQLQGSQAVRTHSHPDGTTCQDPAFPTCSTYGQTCVYVSGSGCDVYWLQYGEG